MSGWDIKLLFDDILFEMINAAYRTRFLLRNGRRYFGTEKNRELKGKHAGGRCFVVGNGPSIKTQNLKLLKDEITFFVNRAFLHPDYEYIQPTYHIFVDPKLQTGEWPVDFLDRVVEKNPNVTFLLSAKFYNDPKFQISKEKYNIYWIDMSLISTRFFKGEVDLSTIGIGGAVVEAGILSAIYMGVKKVYFMGVDGNGLCYNLIGKESHYYGSNPEDLTKDVLTISKDLYFMSMSLRKWVYLANYCTRKNVELVNMTDGGIIDVCPREDFEKLML